MIGGKCERCVKSDGKHHRRVVLYLTENIFAVLLLTENITAVFWLTENIVAAFRLMET